MASLETQFVNEGADPVGGSPQFFHEFIRKEYEKWKKVVLESGAAER